MSFTHSDESEGYDVPLEFDGVTRLFPLPNVVLFPGMLLPLHIFEPRYRPMVSDALASDRLITMMFCIWGEVCQLSAISIHAVLSTLTQTDEDR